MSNSIPRPRCEIFLLFLFLSFFLSFFFKNRIWNLGNKKKKNFWEIFFCRKMKNWNESNKYANELRGRGHVGHTADDVDAEQCAAALTLWARRPPGGARWAPPLCPAAPANHRASLFIGPFSRNFFIISRSADWRLFYFLSIFFFFLNNLFIYFLNLIEFCWVLLLVSPPRLGCHLVAAVWRNRPPRPPSAAAAGRRQRHPPAD